MICFCNKEMPINRLFELDFVWSLFQKPFYLNKNPRHITPSTILDSKSYEVRLVFLVSANSFNVYLETYLVWKDIKSICMYLFGNEHDHRRETSRHVLYIHLWRPFLVLPFLYCFSQVEYRQLFRYNALIQFCDTLQQWRLP